VADWKTPGKYKGPIFSAHGLHILKLLDYQAARKFNLDEDYDSIKEMARQEKTSKLIDKWVSKMQKRTYIEYRL